MRSSSRKSLGFKHHFPNKSRYEDELNVGEEEDPGMCVSGLDNFDVNTREDFASTYRSNNLPLIQDSYRSPRLLGMSLNFVGRQDNQSMNQTR